MARAHIFHGALYFYSLSRDKAYRASENICLQHFKKPCKIYHHPSSFLAFGAGAVCFFAAGVVFPAPTLAP